MRGALPVNVKVMLALPEITDWSPETRLLLKRSFVRTENVMLSPAVAVLYASPDASDLVMSVIPGCRFISNGLPWIKLRPVEDKMESSIPYRPVIVHM